MPRVLADGKIKFTILTTKPTDPAAPTATELNAGIDASCKVALNNFAWSPADSETVNDPELCSSTNAETLGRDNFNCAFTVYRYYLDAGGIDPTADVLFEAVKTKGTTLWGYVRLSDKDAGEPWAVSDEIVLGAEVVTDHPQVPDGGGWIKLIVPCKPQKGWPFIEVSA